jgi:hypothetical protein
MSDTLKLIYIFRAIRSSFFDKASKSISIFVSLAQTWLGKSGFMSIYTVIFTKHDNVTLSSRQGGLSVLVAIEKDTLIFSIEKAVFLGL